MFKQIRNNIANYLQQFNWSEYDFIFVPHRADGHREHGFVANWLLPVLLRKAGYKQSLRIVQYEVWGTMAAPNYFEDISDVIEEKKKFIYGYSSRNYTNYESRMRGLNHYRGLVSGHEYSEAYRVAGVREYLHEKENKRWKKPVR